MIRLKMDMELMVTSMDSRDNPNAHKELALLVELWLNSQGLISSEELDLVDVTNITFAVRAYVKRFYGQRFMDVPVKPVAPPGEGKLKLGKLVEYLEKASEKKIGEREWPKITMLIGELSDILDDYEKGGV